MGAAAEFAQGRRQLQGPGRWVVGQRLVTGCGEEGEARPISRTGDGVRRLAERSQTFDIGQFGSPEVLTARQVEAASLSGIGDRSSLAPYARHEVGLEVAERARDDRSINISEHAAA